MEKTLNAELSITDGWNQVIDFHKNIKEKSYWTDLKQLDFETEQNELKDWLESLATDEPFGKEIIAFWIGINKFLDDSGDETYAIYLVGCESYDKEDIEWATEPTYLPEDRYFISGLLNEIDNKIRTDKDDYSILDWILPLAYSSLTINDLIENKLDSSKFLKYQDKILVTTGYDGGDFMNLKSIVKK